MNDIDALCLKVREPESRRLIADAINAYRGGAFRSAIISTWIAVVYDIFAKARELASQGNSAAQRLVAELDKAIETQDVGSMQRIERQLLEAAEKELLLFGAREAADLKRVEIDRHQCAHPASLLARCYSSRRRSLSATTLSMR